MRARDTTAAAAEMQRAVLRKLSMEQRMLIAASMSDDARQLTRDGIRMRHPDYDDRQVFLAFVRLLHGDDTYSKVWPGEPLLSP
jgi:hypothetical protein